MNTAVTVQRDQKSICPIRKCPSSVIIMVTFQDDGAPESAEIHPTDTLASNVMNRNGADRSHLQTLTP